MVADEVCFVVFAVFAELILCGVAGNECRLVCFYGCFQLLLLFVCEVQHAVDGVVHPSGEGDFGLAFFDERIAIVLLHKLAEILKM